MSNTTIMPDALKGLAKDLTTDFPRSPKEKLAGFAIGMRTLDKCRAVIAGTAGEYHFNCPLDQMFLGFAGLDAEAFKAFVATGASDEQVADWVKQHATQQDKLAIVKWSNDLLYKRLSEMPDQIQLYMDDYMAENIPGRHITYFFDIYDIEEKRM
jgi:Domain of unknown function (DUF5069)